MHSFSFSEPVLREDEETVDGNEDEANEQERVEVNAVEEDTSV